MFLCGAKLRTPKAERRSLAWPCSTRPALRPVPGHHLLTLLRHGAWRSRPLIGSSPGGQILSYGPRSPPAPRLRWEREELGGLRPPPVLGLPGKGMSHPLGSDPLWVGVGRPGTAAGIGALACGQLWPGSRPPAVNAQGRPLLPAGPQPPGVSPSPSGAHGARGPHVPPEVLLVRRPTPCLHACSRQGVPGQGARRRFPLPRRSFRKH